MSRHLKETIIKGIFAFFAFVSVFTLALIVVFLFREGIPIFKEVSVTDFLFRKGMVSHV